MSGWKGLSAELADIEAEPAAGITRTASPLSLTTSEQPAQRVQANPAVARTNELQPRRRRSRGADSFTERHRMVGIYFPHRLDEAFRVAAEQDGVSNSEYVAEAVRQRLQAEGRL